jgi:hypothetical protein
MKVRKRVVGPIGSCYGVQRRCRSYRPLVFFGQLPGPPLVGLAPAQAIKLRAFSPKEAEIRTVGPIGCYVGVQRAACATRFGSRPVSGTERHTDSPGTR